MARFTVEDFINAAYDGDLDKVKHGLQHGFNVDAKNRKGRPALSCACSNGRSDVAKLLIEAGADVNLEYDGWSPLSFCVGDLSLMQTLIQHGADLHWRSGSKEQEPGWTLPMLAAAKSEFHEIKNHPVGILKFLHQNGCDLDAQAEDGKTALMVAAQGGPYELNNLRVEITQVLIDLGADLDLRDNEGYTAIMYAAQHIFRGEFEQFHKNRYSTVDEQSMAAARDIIKILKNADADEKGIESIEIRYAAARKDIKEVRRLLARGVNINLRSPRGTPSLSAAIEDPEILDLFLAAGADPNNTKPDMDTPLHFAVRRENFEAVKKLVEAGADINVEGALGTPLEYATSLDNKEIVDYLKKQGAKNMYAQERGLATAERDLTAVLVHADIDSAAKALAALLPGAEHQPGIQNENVRAADECYLVYQLDGHVWTHLHPAKAKRGECVYGPDLAKKLSKKLDTQAIFFENDDTAGYIGYQLFDKGKRTEDVFIGADFAEAAFLWKPGPHTIPDEEEEILRARSTRRKLSPKDLEDPDFFDRFLRDADAYLPAWSERDLRIGKTKRYFAKLDPDIFVRVDFVRRTPPEG